MAAVKQLAVTLKIEPTSIVFDEQEQHGEHIHLDNVIFVIEIIIVSMRVCFMRRNQIETCNERCRVRLTCLVF